MIQRHQPIAISHAGNHLREQNGDCKTRTGVLLQMRYKKKT